jgi:hypothetical protein
MEPSKSMDWEYSNHVWEGCIKKIPTMFGKVTLSCKTSSKWPRTMLLLVFISIHGPSLTFSLLHQITVTIQLFFYSQWLLPSIFTDSFIHLQHEFLET